MFVPGEHSSNDLSFSVKIHTKSELEILVLAMPNPCPLPIDAYANSFNSPTSYIALKFFANGVMPEKH
jgi:hypothetical protein